MKSKRPIKMWNDKQKKNEPHRCYGTEKAARAKALTLVDQMPIGSTLTIYNNDIGAWLGTFRIGVKSIDFLSKHDKFAIARKS